LLGRYVELEHAGEDVDAAIPRPRPISTAAPPAGRTGPPHDTNEGMGEITFNGLSLLTAQGRVMTPRAATGQLVAAALERLGERPARVVDVGTGSGAIALAVAAAALQAEFWATDTSRCAVALTRLNARRQGLQDRVIVRHGDLLEPVPGPI
jgi:HemK-like putative methylase